MRLEPGLFKASAPGSLMLMGEHAVLRNKSALAFAIDKRVSVSVRLRDDDRVVIRSNLGEYSGTLAELTIEAPFTFVLAAVDTYRSKFTHGLELIIESQFSDKMGFGSSAAVVVATLKSFEKILNSNWTSEELFQAAKKVVQRVQGLGSGTDVAASVYGGVVFYQPLLNQIEKLNILLPVVVLYSGYKTPTQAVVQQVDARSAEHPELFESLFDSMEACTQQARLTLEEKNWPRLGELMNIHQGLQAALGVSDAVLDQLIHALRNCSEIYGAKISGAGLGDCVMGLGKLTSSYSGKLDPLTVQGSLRGVSDEF